MPTADVDVAEIIGAVQRHHVEYVVIGGFAVELWDVAVPPTRDVDITPDRSTENLRRLAEALNQLDASLRVSGGEPLPVPGGLTPELLAQTTVLNLTTSAGALDITMLPAGTDGYPELVADSRTIDYQGMPVPVASLEDVLRSKEWAGREKDLRVIPAIQAHLDRSR